MKNFYTVILSVTVFSAAIGFAQNRIAKDAPMSISSFAASKNNASVHPMNMADTITNHWDVIEPVAVDVAGVYVLQDGGYIAGQNGYGDLTKAQKFDSNYGVTSTNGTITNLLLWVGRKKQNAGTAQWIPTIWDDNAGVPGTVIGTATPITVAQMNTSATGILGIIGSAAAVEGRFNINATFSPAIAIPGNQIFWAGFSITYAAGDSAGLVTSQDLTDGDGMGVTGDFLDASTHTFEKWNDGSWHSFNDGTNDTWELDIALAVYPVIDFVTGINEQNSNVLTISNIPNPAKDNTMIHYELKETCPVEFSLFDLAGKKLSALNQGVQSSGSHQFKFDVTNLSSGVYFYTISAGDYKRTNKMSVVK